jgi:Trk K+ transport system NAD-binding subunit
VKFLTPQFDYLRTHRESRRNISVLLRYVGIVSATVLLYSGLFHVLMLHEGQEHSLLTGLYWTLTVMSTLGFGDITFHTDLGRVFSLVVLLSGIVMLLIVLPFAFIRFFYAPWLEAQLHLRAPRHVPSGLKSHVIFCRYDEVAAGLIERLRDSAIPYCVIEPDPSVAAALHGDGVSVVTGDLDNRETYDAVACGAARLVIANRNDAENSNIALIVHEHYPAVPIAAFAEEVDSVDVLELSGATHVLPLKQRLGEYLAGRASVGPAHAQPVGRFKNLRIVEFPVENTGLSGRTIRDTRLRELTGLNIVACWERGHLLPARAGTVLTDHSVLVAVGTSDQIAELDALFVIYNPNENPVLVIGGGKVGQAAMAFFRRVGVAISVIERDPELRPTLAGLADNVVIGDASHRSVIMKAGLETAPTVVLTTNDDAWNIFLAVYCRRLNPSTRIVSRITHERSLEAIHRAGADSVLSYATLGVKSLLAYVQGSEATFVGEGVDLFIVPVPASLTGLTLGGARIGEIYGLNVVALQHPDGSAENVMASTELAENTELVMLGTAEQRKKFRAEFG